MRPLFPIPLMRCPGLAPSVLVARAIGAIEAAALEPSRRGPGLSHAPISAPDQNAIHQAIADLAGPKLVDFGEHLFGERLTWRIKEIWSNILEPGGAQPMHAHSNSFVSGVLYLTRPHPDCRTVFIRPPGGADFGFRHETETTRQGPYNAPAFALPHTEPGDLVLFPSYLFHEAPLNTGARRITVAFNAVPEFLDYGGYRITFGEQEG